MKTGRNEPCPCGSGKKYKKCCGNITTTNTPLINPPSSTPYLGVYLNFELLYPREPNSLKILRQELRSFNSDDFLQVLAKLNYLFSEIYWRNDSSNIALLQGFIESSALKRATDLLKKGEINVLFTHHQILALMIENLLEAVS